MAIPDFKCSSHIYEPCSINYNTRNFNTVCLNMTVIANNLNTQLCGIH